jgi:hypothetical protein
MIGGIQLTKKQLERQVPKVALSLDEIYWSFGDSKGLVEALRAIGALKGKRFGTRLMFGADEAKKVWAEYQAGKYDGQLERERG